MRLPAPFRLLLVLLAATALPGCGDDPTMPDFADSLGIDLTAMTRTSSGLYYLDLAPGSGNPAVNGSTAEVAYSGWLADGFLFDSGSFSFTVGIGQVIAGFDEGVRGMRVGGKRRLVIPPELGYGARANGPIPPNSTLVFEVELLKLD